MGAGLEKEGKKISKIAIEKERKTGFLQRHNKAAEGVRAVLQWTLVISNVDILKYHRIAKNIC